MCDSNEEVQYHADRPTHPFHFKCGKSLFSHMKTKECLLANGRISEHGLCL